MLKFVEMMRHMERSKTGGKAPQPSGGMFLSRIAQRFREQSVVTELTVNPEDVRRALVPQKKFVTLFSDQNL